MTTRTAPVVSTRQFTYVPEARDFVATASELPGIRYSFVMVSSRTGKEIVFRLTHTEVDQAENEVRFWVFRSVKGNFTATVIND